MLSSSGYALVVYEYADCFILSVSPGIHPSASSSVFPLASIPGEVLSTSQLTASIPRSLCSSFQCLISQNYWVLSINLEHSNGDYLTSCFVGSSLLESKNLHKIRMVHIHSSKMLNILSMLEQVLKQNWICQRVTYVKKDTDYIWILCLACTKKLILMFVC